MKVAMIGAGAYGTALGGILTTNDIEVKYYDSIFEGVRISDVLDGADYVVLCVPSQAVADVLPELPKNVPLIVATKGIMSARTFGDFNDYMVMSGPGFAQDIEQGVQTFLTATDQRIIRLFEADYLSFDYTDDRSGVLMCGALKNIYAIWAGMLGLKRDTEEWNKYIDTVCDEMKLILEANNARPETVDLACGVGDLKLTCGMPSRNYEFGVKKNNDPNYTPEKTVEGLSAIERIHHNEIVVPNNAVIMHEILGRFK